MNITSLQEEKSPKAGKGDVMKGRKPLKNRNGRELLSTAEYREHLELYGDRISSIFAGISPKSAGTAASSGSSESSLNYSKVKDIDIGLTNNGLR